jgi:hypothetical protein
MKTVGTLSLVLAICAVSFHAFAQRSTEPADVSMIQLIASPEKYDGKLIRVIGFLRLEFEGDALYYHKEDYEQSISKNAVWVNTTPEMMKHKDQLNNHYALLEGVFDAKRLGHMGMFSGEISKIGRAITWPNPGSENSKPVGKK